MEKSTPLRRLDVRLDKPTIFINTLEDSRSSQFVTGRVILMNQEPLPVKSIKVWLRAERKVAWFIKCFSYQYVQNVDNVLLKELSVYPPSPHIKPASRLEPGNHAWQFCFEIETPVTESIQGLAHASLKYLVEAEASMKGFMSSNLRASQNFQVVRAADSSTVSISSLEQKKSGVWSNSVEYHVCAPPACRRWGEPIDLDFRITPTTNIKLGKVKLELREKIKLRATFDKRMISNESEIAVTTGERDLSDESNEFHLRFPLPRSLKVCRQSVKENRIQISHGVHIEIEFEDEGGRLAQIHVDFPFLLVFPPGITFDDAGNACFDGVIPVQTTEGESLLDIPPPFGRHYEDELYVQAYPTSYHNTIAGNAQTSPQSGASREIESLPTREAVAAVGPSDMTPSYELAVQIPEMYIDRDSPLPAYDIISSDGVDTRLGELGRIGIPLPAICRSRQLY